MEDRDKTAQHVSNGLTQEQAAELICVSPPTYIAREKLPEVFYR